MHLTLILTEACNLRCRYCYQPRFADSAMAVETARKAMLHALARDPESLALTFFGGEPLLCKDALFAILGEARALERERGAPVTANVSTNGLLLDDAFIAEAERLGLFISLSHDGVPSAHNAGRVTLDGAGSFDAADAALRRLVGARQPFAVYSVITPDNVCHLAASQDHFWRTGARILLTALDYTAAWDSATVRELRRQYARVGRVYRERLRARGGFHLEPFDSRIGRRTRADAFKGCSPGLGQLTVAPDGTLYGCIEYFHRRLRLLGDVEAWLDDAAVAALVRERSARQPECLACGVGDRCMNACACVNLRTSGCASIPGEAVCRLEQETIRATDALAARLYRARDASFLARHYSCSFHLLSGIEAWLSELEADHEHTAPR